ncbi:MAG: hypothetical protein IPL26_00180 [Leptospiraceae bacterium]|nr:hypothetical protein [Leptospiraceae bacterium]
MNNEFLRLFGEFCKSKNIVEVAVNSSYRSDVVNSYHFQGWALDIYYVKYKSGKVEYFTVRDKNYSVGSDESFFKSFNSYFSNYRREYISPAVIFTGYIQGWNKFKNKTWKEKNNELDKLFNQSLPYEINRNHLHHLHLGINPDKNAQKMIILFNFGKSLLPVLIVFAVFVWKNKKAQDYIKKVLKWNS